MKKYFFLALLLLPLPVLAHVKWFVNESQFIIEPFRLLEPAVLIWIGIIISAIVVGTFLEKILTVPKWLKDLGEQHHTMVAWIFHILLGAWLILAALNHTLLIPSLHLELTSWNIAWLIIEAVTGIILFLPRGKKIGAIILAVLYCVSFVLAGSEMLGHVLIVGLILFFLLNSSDWDMSWLRFFTGVSLIILALQEKLLHPELAAEFLETHPWNFMQLLGIDWFSDRLFILSAGMNELLFGIILVLGIVTRINTAVMSIFFTITVFLLGAHELIGHLPIYAIAIVLIMYGSGKRLKITNLLPNAAKTE